MRLGDADREMAVAFLLQLLDLVAHLGVGGDFARAIELGRDGGRLVPDRRGFVIDEMEVARRLVDQIDDGAGELLGALAAFRPMTADDDRRVEIGDAFFPEASISAGVSAVKWLIATTTGRP